jgi:hypothetical protein
VAQWYNYRVVASATAVPSLEAVRNPQKRYSVCQVFKVNGLYCTGSTDVCGGDVALAKQRLPEYNSGHSGGESRLIPLGHMSGKLTYVWERSCDEFFF